jgi:cell wall-associated NlpC family hydrolase
MNAIINLPLVPIRESDNERSELYSQLLFGERVEIIEIHDHWLFVKNKADNYRGWVDKKMVQLITYEEEERIEKTAKYTVQVPILHSEEITSKQNMFLPGGSIIHTDRPGIFTLGNKTYSINSEKLKAKEEITGQDLVGMALQYLNAPYLWGGKSIFGIDCSGFVQVVFAMCSIQLLRDASEQVESGHVIDFLSESRAGDLAFFENADGRIIHVGILINSKQIIHSSGWVKIETIDSNGIISSQTGEYSHKLRVIKRYI